MKNRSIQFLATICLFVTLFTQVHSQDIMVVMRVRVDPENIPEFLHKLRTYQKPAHQKAISENRLSSWNVYQRIGGFDLHKDHNFAAVRVYTPEQFANRGRLTTDLEALFPDLAEEVWQISNSITLHDQLFYRVLAYHEKATPSIIRVNFSKADKRDYFRMEPEIWGPFIDEQMKAGKTKVVSWGFSSLIIPRGTEAEHDAVSVDGFNSLEDALLGSGFDDDVQLPENIDELMAAHHKANVHLYRHVITSADE